MDPVIILGRTEGSGMIVATMAEYDWSWFLTDCCAASGKGTTNAESGVCCRACYDEVDASYGGVYDERFDGKIEPLDAETVAFVLSKGNAVLAESATA